MATVIDKAVLWAVGIANDDSHGYDQSGRWGPDYDCSSLVIQAYHQAGVPVKSYGASTTKNMYKAFLKAGFADVTASVNLKTGEGTRKGDVMLRVGKHTEMISTAGKLVGAHINEVGGTIGGQDGDQTGKEINVRSYYNYPWDKCLRYPGGSSESFVVDKSMVISSNAYLGEADMQQNAMYIAAYLLNEGWTMEAIAGMLGNIQAESTINPGIWQSLKEGNTSGGFGLTQWTPATKLIDWATDQGLDYKDIDTQLKRILYEVEEGIQFYSTDTYPINFKDFTTSTKTPEWLAGAFLYNYERPAEYNITPRQNNARYWYNFLSALDLAWLPGYKDTKRKGMSFLLLAWAATRRT